MATYCTKCGGTGQTINNKFCTCSDGKFLKTMAAAREKTMQAAREAEKREAEKKALMEEKAKAHLLKS
jgi:DnaJ-class molecular chaperone